MYFSCFYVSPFQKRKVCEIICKLMDLGHILAHSVFYLYAYELIFPATHYANTESLAGDGNSCWIFISLLHSWVQAILVPTLHSLFTEFHGGRLCQGSGLGFRTRHWYFRRSRKENWSSAFVGSMIVIKPIFQSNDYELNSSNQGSNPLCSQLYPH